MLLRISTLATGRTGVRPETLAAYVDLLNAKITPIVPEYGSLGCPVTWPRWRTAPWP